MCAETGFSVLNRYMEWSQCGQFPSASASTHKETLLLNWLWAICFPHPHIRRRNLKALSPTLFLLVVNDIKETLCRQVKIALYVDDSALLSSAKTVGASRKSLQITLDQLQNLQITLDQLQQWIQDWSMNINTQKTTYTLFIPSPKRKQVKLNIGKHTMSKDDSPRYLGTHFDSHLTWKNQNSECQRKGIKKTNLMKKLAGKTLRANMSILKKKTYQRYVHPALEYSMAAWGTCSNTLVEKLNTLQNQDVQLISGEMTSTPIVEMETFTGLESLNERRDRKFLTQYTKINSHTQQPLHARTKKSDTRRLKRTNFI